MNCVNGIGRNKGDAGDVSVYEETFFLWLHLLFLLLQQCKIWFYVKADLYLLNSHI